MANIAIEIDKDKLRDFCRRWKITEFALFGSVVREDFGPHSDVDVLVTFAPDAPAPTLTSWIAMRDELTSIFGRAVDLVERRGIDRMRNYLRREAIIQTAVLLDVA